MGGRWEMRKSQAREDDAVDGCRLKADLISRILMK